MYNSGKMHFIGEGSGYVCISAPFPLSPGLSGFAIVFLCSYKQTSRALRVLFGSIFSPAIDRGLEGRARCCPKNFVAENFG